MTTQVVEFIRVSEVMDCTSDLWCAFCDSSPDCSWGDNPHSLVRPDWLATQLEELDDYGDPDYKNQVIERLKAIDKGVFIDLEN